MKLYGIIGNTLRHSYSKEFFNEKFGEQNIVANYENFLLPSIDSLKAILKCNPNLQGLNVTIPFKQAVFGYLDEVDPIAQEIGAVNVIKITNIDGKSYLKGFNTDWYGFSESISPYLKKHHTDALILGTGGASKAVAFALKKLNINSTFVSRDKNKALTYNELTEEIVKKNKIIINTTPVGTFPKVKECPPFPYQYIDSKHLVYDLIYNPIRSLFLQQSETRGATIVNGWTMLVNQAFESYKIWEGKPLLPKYLENEFLSSKDKRADME